MTATDSFGKSVIALDIDGTIADYAGRISDRVRRVVRAISESPSAHLVLVTGRSVVGVAASWRQLGLGPGNAVSSNGAVTLRMGSHIARGHQVRHAKFFNPQTTLRLIRRHIPDGVFASEQLGQGFRVTEAFPPGELQGDQIIVPFEELAGRPAARCIVRGPDRRAADFAALVERVGPPDVSWAMGWSAWLDLSAAGIDKSYGLAKVVQGLGCRAEDVVAIGDGLNDLPMFAWAGRSIAMGQADLAVRLAADEVCGSVSSDGLADVLEDLMDGLPSLPQAR